MNLSKGFTQKNIRGIILESIKVCSMYNIDKMFVCYFETFYFSCYVSVVLLDNKWFSRTIVKYHSQNDKSLEVILRRINVTDDDILFLKNINIINNPNIVNKCYQLIDYDINNNIICKINTLKSVNNNKNYVNDKINYDDENNKKIDTNDKIYNDNCETI